MTAIRIALAGVPAEVVCRHPENVAFLAEYRTEEAPVFRVDPTDADLRKARDSLEQTARREGRPMPHCREDQVENAAIHRLLAEGLAFRDVLLVHGSALCMDGDAYVFIAPSGTGKSTHARLWRQAFGDRVWMINDDKPMLRIGDAGVTVYGTPWNGKHRLGRNASAPLRAMVSLERSAENRIAPLPKADALPVLMRQVFRSADPAAARRIVELETRLLEAVDFYVLSCNTDPEAAVTAWSGVRR